jgi:hypothetical protein
MFAAARAVRALASLDATIEEAEAALDDAVTRPGFPSRPWPNDAIRDARALRAWRLEHAAALRRDLAELLADAEACFLEVSPGAIPIASVEAQIESAPRLLSGITLEPVEAARYLVELTSWYKREVARHLRSALAATDDLTACLDRSDPATAQLVDALASFSAEVRGSGRADQAQ